jgi:NADP-reducing hydrogenase subunit HndB
MATITCLEDLKRAREQARQHQKQAITRPAKTQVRVAMSLCSIAAGAEDTLEALQEMIKNENLSTIEVSITGCMGLCAEEPLLEVCVADHAKVLYGKVTAPVARRIVSEHILAGEIVQEYFVQP